MVKNVIVVSDIHAGCQFGLFPVDTPIHLDGGGFYAPSENQIITWGWWRYFWDKWVPKVTRGEDYAIVVNGDLIDGEHHKNKTHISTNFATQEQIACAILAREVEKAAGGLYVVRGTEAHVGKSAENEERCAKALGAVPDHVGNYSRHDLWMFVGGEDGCLVNFAHHIGCTVSMQYESTAVMRELATLFSLAGRWHNRAPDIVVRSHRHISTMVQVPTANGYGIAVVTPGWQLKTPFIYNTGAKNEYPQFGGVLIRQGDEEHYTRSKVWNIERTQTVVV